MPEGSWKCEKCNNINYPFRTKCNRQNCGAEKPTESKKSPSNQADENDQVCYLLHSCLKCYQELVCWYTFHLFVNSENVQVVDLSVFEIFLIGPCRLPYSISPFLIFHALANFPLFPFHILPSLSSSFFFFFIFSPFVSMHLLIYSCLLFQ